MMMNMTQICKKNGITSFARTRGGWMKIVEGYDKTQYGGFRFVGSNFVKVGNYDADLTNGLYLDCSKHFDKEDEKVVEIMNLFKIEDGEVELLKTIPKATKGWAYQMDDIVDDYFANEGVTTYDVMNAIRNVTSNKDILREVALEILKDDRDKVWLNETELQAYLQLAHIHAGSFDLLHSSVEDLIDEINSNKESYHKVIRYFDDEIGDESERNSLYAFIHAHPRMKEYRDYELVFEDIKEDYYRDLKNVEKLGKFNRNELVLTQGKAINDVGYYFSFQHGMWANHKVVYIVAPNAVEKKILIQRFKLQLI